MAHDHLSLRAQRVRELRVMLANRAEELHPNFTSLAMAVAQVLNDAETTIDECRVLHGKHKDLLK
jgi:hypothetical protein